LKASSLINTDVGAHGACKSHPTNPRSHAEMDVSIKIPHKLYLYGKFESASNTQQKPHQPAVWTALV